MAHLDQFATDRSAGFDHRRVQTLENVRVCFQREPDELLDFPVNFLVAGFKLLRDTGERPLEVSRR